MIWFFAASWTSGLRGFTVVSTIQVHLVSGFQDYRYGILAPPPFNFCGISSPHTPASKFAEHFRPLRVQIYEQYKKNAVIIYVRFLDPACLSYVDYIVGKFRTEITICGQIEIKYQVFRREILHHLKFCTSHNR